MLIDSVTELSDLYNPEPVEGRPVNSFERRFVQSNV